MFPVFLFLGFSKLLAFGEVIDGNKKLILVQAIWRHGDRAPTSTYKNDKFTEDYWQGGGGGWGQLTPNGMKQHLKLGRKLRDRYVNGKPYKFLSENYNQKEIFVRSSDKNRTLLSAYANMIGMYSSTGRNENYTRPDVDYPDDENWPVGLVPIPIHTAEIEYDRLLDVDGPCQLQSEVWEIAKTTEPVAEFWNNTNVTSFMEELTNYCGEEINLENLWILYNSLKIEKLYYDNIFQNMTPWYTDEIFNKIDIYNSQVQDFQDGIGLDGINSNGIDVGRTLKRIRGGTLVTNLYERMIRKSECQGKMNPACKYMNNLKYVAFSAHDTTLYAVLSIFGLSHVAVQPRGYPLYAATILIELWEDVKTKQPFFKFIYARNENDTLDNALTSNIKGCSNDFCNLKVFANYSRKYEPEYEMSSWCYDYIDSTNSAFNFFSFIFSIFIFLFVF